MSTPRFAAAYPASVAPLATRDSPKTLTFSFSKHLLTQPFSIHVPLKRIYARASLNKFGSGLLTYRRSLEWRPVRTSNLVI